MTDPLQAFPEKFSSGDIANQTVYRKLHDYYALHGLPSGGIPGAEFTLEGGTVAVYRGEFTTARIPDDVIPGAVYTAQDGVLPCVPTGRVLIRYPEGDSVENHRPNISDAGMRIEELLSYAPHAAWLIARTGVIADALNALSRLTSLPGVVSAEAQLLRQRVTR